MWTASQKVLHGFPTKICSIHVTRLRQHTGARHSNIWVCVRTLSSTVFASLKIPRRTTSQQEISSLRLTGALEILHGESVLESGIEGVRDPSTGFHHGIKTVRSNHPIMDVAFNPHTSYMALTVDTRGALGKFDCDLTALGAMPWSGVTEWVEIPGTAHYNTNSVWRIAWSDDEALCVTASSEAVWITDVATGYRTEMFAPSDADILSISADRSPIPLLWVATTNGVSLFDLRMERVGISLLSIPHNRNSARELRLSVLNKESKTIAVLSSGSDGLMVSYTIFIEATTGKAIMEGEPRSIATVNHLCAPIFQCVDVLNHRWKEWMRSKLSVNLWLSRVFIEVDMDADGALWLRLIQLSPRDMITSARLCQQHEIDIVNPSNEVQKTDAPKLGHSLHGLYQGKSTPTMMSVPQFLLALFWNGQRDIKVQKSLGTNLRSAEIARSRLAQCDGSSDMMILP